MSTPADLPTPTHEPSLKNVIDQDSLRWVFVGGKGGVGKTTCASSLAVQLAAVRRSVLVISTDPAHNLSDAFRQKLTKQPVLVNGFDNLYAMEVDPTLDPADLEALDAAAAGFGGGGAGGGGAGGGGGGFMAELAGSIPGIDEAMSFAEVMKQVQSLDHDVIVFDTAPTGHTLRLLNFPTLLEKGLGKLQQLRQSLGGAMGAVSRMMGSAGMPGEEEGGLPPPEAVLARLDDMLHVVQKVNSQFQDPALTTFVCVCIPEFLSLYETERLVQELAKFGVDTRNVVVNQLLYPDCAPGVSPLLDARVSMQQKYLRQFYDLYDDDFHLTRLPLLREEVRGADALKAFGKNLVVPYEAPERPKSEEDAVAALRKRVGELEAEVAALKKK
jgi:arsenite/tail-anchored protein-transporting ATPase